MRNEYRLRKTGSDVVHLAAPAYGLGSMHRAGEELTALCGIVAIPTTVQPRGIGYRNCKRCQKIAHGGEDSNA